MVIASDFGLATKIEYPIITGKGTVSKIDIVYN